MALLHVSFLVAAIVIFASIPRGAQFRHDFRLGQILDEVISHQDFVYQKRRKRLNPIETILLKIKSVLRLPL